MTTKTELAERRSPAKEVLLDNQERAYAAIKRNGREGLTMAQVARIVGSSITGAHTFLNKMVEKKQIVKRRNGHHFVYAVPERRNER